MTTNPKNISEITARLQRGSKLLIELAKENKRLIAELTACLEGLEAASEEETPVTSQEPTDTDAEKIAIAKEFIALHTHNDFKDWKPYKNGTDAQYLAIYYRLKVGVYNEVLPTGLENYRAVMINADDHINGHVILFEFKYIN